LLHIHHQHSDSRCQLILCFTFMLAHLCVCVMLTGVDASPLMTWGEIEGTPFRLDGSDTPVVPSGRGPTFKIPEVPRRDRLLHELAEKASKAHRAKKEVALKQAAASLSRSQFYTVYQLHLLVRILTYRVPEWITFKLATLVFQCVNGTAPGYLSADMKSRQCTRPQTPMLSCIIFTCHSSYPTFYN